ncbi:MAG: hypothetical protein II502_01200 [Paludibacteraceae bacterium]|nr:hypothetical protein [Paludibacteraceae bacterium]
MASLDELTTKIYQDGSEKGKNAADNLIAEAEAKSAQIVSQAEKKAQEIVEQAKKQAEELSANCKSELKLYKDQCVSALKTEITDLICGKVVTENVKVATTDVKFMQEIIAKLAQEMAKNGDVIIETKDAEAITKYFTGNAKDVLNKGVEIQEVKDIKTAFSIVSKNGGYKLSFGDKEFEAFFKEFLRPQLIELLFG